MAGITGRLYQQFALTIVVSVIVSSINAISLSPALSSILLKEPTTYGGLLGKFFGVFNKYMGKTTDAYMSFTAIVARKLKRSVIFIVIISIAAGIFGTMVPGGFIPEEDMGYFFINMQLPDAASLQRSDEITTEIEDLLMDIPEVEFVTAVTGYSIVIRCYVIKYCRLFLLH